ncbi:MAG: ABC transporter substrate-binding protein [Frankia sp.]
MIHTKTRLLAAGAAAAALVVAAGCGSSGSSGSATSSGPSTKANKTITIGLLTDRSGPAASGNKTSVEGVKAGAVLAAREGYTIKYIVADTATNPATALSAAQKLVTQNHVTAVIAHSALTFAASTYLTSHGIPVVGAAEDGPEWITAKNMFSVFGAIHSTKVSTTQGLFFKMQGVTNLAALGYSISPTSSEAAKAAQVSAQKAGIKVGYLNSKFPFGSTNVAPIALEMKKAGINGFTASTDPNTAFSLITALRQQGVDIKAALLPTGYGGDLIQAGPGALKAAQNVYFVLGYEPIEMQTAATKQFAADLKSSGTTGEPTFAMYNGYVSVGLLLQGLKGAGADPTHASLIASLSTIHAFTALGLFGSHKLDINDRTNLVNGVDNCAWITKLEGSTFTLVKGATPICGSEIRGVTVAPSS